MFGAPVPIFRIFDETKAREFYVDYLGFKIGFEHRFAADAPLYLGLVRDACVLHLSEHHGDGSPGVRIRVPASVTVLHAELSDKDYKYARPGIEHTPWGTRELRVADPFGNTLIFYEPSDG